jgi:phospholipase D-like protein
MFALISGLVGLLFVALCFGLGLAVMVFWIWMLIDAITNRGISDGEKIAWVLVIIFLHALGGLIYLIVGHPKRAGAVIS